uniref:Uncharacterized protein n=1 Tax=Populus trichocarpa TaxID=3694 RepID=U5GGV1_POPTR
MIFNPIARSDKLQGVCFNLTNLRTMRHCSFQQWLQSNNNKQKLLRSKLMPMSQSQQAPKNKNKLGKKQKP